MSISSDVTSNQAPVRVRFAPSPTGFLHVGSVRAALFNWLYARHLGGKFLLRIEDTDLERSEDRFTQDIMNSMKWLGLEWDEEPIFQSKRLGVYLEKAEELIRRGHAYRCYCTEAEVGVMREVATQAGKKPQYDRRCRDLGDLKREGPFVIRARIPLDGFVEFNDLIHGAIRFENEGMDDFVLIRSNGAPTYNLSVVVDDVESKMTHILRGDDHINNTPKQIHLYRFFEYAVPVFAHLPMILGEDKKKLSKRHGAVSVSVYREEGYLPESLLNFLVRLGWSHGDQEIFTVNEMIRFFGFDHVQKSAAVFNMEKLLWLNGTQIRAATKERLLGIIVDESAAKFSARALERAKTDLGAELVALIQPKVKLIHELADQLVPLCTPGALEVDTKELKWNKDSGLKVATQAAVKHMIEDLKKKVSAESPVNRVGRAWGSVPSLKDIGMDHAGVDAYLRQVGVQHGVKLGDLTQPMRLVITGRLVSAGLFDLLAILPWDVCEERLDRVASL